MVKALAERITQILDSPASSQEKMPADKVKQQLIVREEDKQFELET